MKRVFVTGMGIVSPLGNSVDEVASNLWNGNSGIGDLTRLSEFGWFSGSNDFPVKLAAELKEKPDMSGIPAKKQRNIARFARYILCAANQINPTRLFMPDNDDSNRFGIFLGCLHGGIEEQDQMTVSLVNKEFQINPLTAVHTLPSSAAGKLAQVFSINDSPIFTGESTTYLNGCASAAVAIGNAFRKIRCGEIDVALTGGGEAPISPTTLTYLNNLGALTRQTYPTSSKPFDEYRDGYTLGEGAAMFTLESEEHVKMRGGECDIVAEIVGYATTVEGFSDTSPDPKGKGMYNAMKLALADADIGAGSIGYVNAHATSTRLGDAAESFAIRRLFGTGPSVSSTKGHTGHSEGAAGAIELLLSIISLRDSLLPATLNLTRVSDCANLDYVTVEPRHRMLNFVMSNSSGFGGYNSALIIKKNYDV
jgi:3-oxoacyl-[acyl-carrier-protein] synthase II